MAECVAHLNLTAGAYLPLLDAALGHARMLGGPLPDLIAEFDLSTQDCWPVSLPPMGSRSGGYGLPRPLTRGCATMLSLA
jgi:hypothetical protein